MHYIVQHGDTLGNIAYKHGTTVHAIMATNGLTNPDLIHAGQKLIIPMHPHPMHAHYPVHHHMPMHDHHLHHRVHHLETRIQHLEHRINRLEQGHLHH